MARNWPFQKGPVKGRMSGKTSEKWENFEMDIEWQKVSEYDHEIPQSQTADQPWFILNNQKYTRMLINQENKTTQ